MPRSRPEPWPVALAVLLAAMMGVSVGFYRIASDHPDPLVVDDPYAAGLAYSERVRAARRAEALGWEIELRAELAAGAAGVRVEVRDAAGRPLEPERVVVRRERPAQGGYDTAFELSRANGEHTGRIPLPLPGRWQLVVRAERGDEAAERAFALRAP